MDKELLLHEAMARILSKAGNHWDTYDNHKVSEALEHYLNRSADKDEVVWIDESDLGILFNESHPVTAYLQ